MSRFSWREEAGTPSWPLSSTTTPVAPAPLGTTPLTPATNALLWVPWVPILVVADSSATPMLEMSMLLEPVVRLPPAKWPTATFPVPVVLESSACHPRLELLLPVELNLETSSPTAAFSLPVVLKASANWPNAALRLPVVLLVRADSPNAEFSAPMVLDSS